MAAATMAKPIGSFTAKEASINTTRITTNVSYSVPNLSPPRLEVAKWKVYTFHLVVYSSIKAACWGSAAPAILVTVTMGLSLSAAIRVKRPSLLPSSTTIR